MNKFLPAVFRSGRATTSYRCKQQPQSLIVSNNARVCHTVTQEAHAQGVSTFIRALRRPIPTRMQSQSLRPVDAEPNSRGLLSIYVFSPDKNRWCRVNYAQAEGAQPSSAPTSLRLLTWNVDFMAPRADGRFKRALEHIQHDVFKRPDGSPPEPCIILLQEIEAEVIPVLLSNEWVRAHFQVTPISNWNWPNQAHYGSITLTARSIPVLSASSLVFANSHMSRNALIVDVHLARGPAELLGKDTGTGTETEIVGNVETHAVMFRIRFVNVHLESLEQGASARPQQLALVAEALNEPGIKAGLVCGDMNSIMDCDKNLPSSLGLSDAYIGNDDDPQGHTWGYQPRCNFPPKRLDKILYTPGRGLIVQEPERVGVDVKTAEGYWASDHYGLSTTVSVAKE